MYIGVSPAAAYIVESQLNSFVSPAVNIQMPPSFSKFKSWAWVQP